MTKIETTLLEKFNLLLSYDIEEEITHIRVVKMDRLEEGIVVQNEEVDIVMNEVENIEAMYVMLINAIASIMFSAHHDNIIKSHVSYTFILSELEKAFLSTSYRIAEHGDSNN